MNPITVSPKFRVAIPREVREKLNLVPARKVQVLALEYRIELIPVRPMKSMKGFLKGIDTELPREDERT